MTLLDQHGAPIGAAVIVCRGCGCDDNHACIDPDTGEPCSWALLDVNTASGFCSCCAERARWHPVALACIGQPGGDVGDYVPAGLERYLDDLAREIAA